MQAAAGASDAGLKFSKSGRLVQDETAVVGSIPMHVYRVYWGHMGSMLLVCAALIDFGATAIRV